ncbi:MAG: single-stranded DNA-binding protein [Bacteroidales bacterium]|nr:single-stranded DNA-binding protein [Bacteroidales bacterium]MCR5276698.1 single-stranded DNA-binding protein [Bacteroidales bacterium]
MEQMNRIELRGNVGSIRIQTNNERKMARFTLATNKAYKDRNGEPVIETTWHNISAFEGKNIQNLDRLEKGSKAHVVGRVRIQKIMGLDGNERTFYDVLASRVNLIEEDSPLEFEL